MIFHSLDTILYEKCLSSMEGVVQKIIDHKEQNQIWFLEHLSVYTAGLSSKPEDLINPLFPVVQTNRGGQYTYHGKGQLVIYVMIFLNKKDVKQFINHLAEWVLRSLKEVELNAYFDADKVGIFIRKEGAIKKIASIGMRFKKWVSFHGIAININPTLSDFKGIVPCGLKDVEMTSLFDLGLTINRFEFEDILKKTWIDF
ncbi:MAG: lipoyl(octanoyl) transferase LipB [Proteobacteria bacterium]|nr:lipoyl(octanoyl) transferase LipB [Pseudomonadota bacterium]